MAAQLAPGKYNLEKSEKFDELMRALGVGMATRLIGNQAKPSQEIQVSPDGEWTISTSSIFKNTVIKFKPGQPFEETTMDGRTVSTTCSVEGNKLVQNQKGSFDTVTTREFTQDGFTMTIAAKDVVCTRIYKRA